MPGHDATLAACQPLSVLELDDQDLMLFALDKLEFVLGSRPPDDISCPSAYMLVVAAALRTFYVGIFEIDNQSVTPLGR